MKRLYNLSYYFLELCIKIAIILLVFSALRFLFYVSHSSFLPTETFCDVLSVFCYALRFDLSAVCYVNLLLILSYLLPIPLRDRPWYKGIQQLIFVTFNGIAVIFELVDIAYFPFILRRSNAGDLALAANTIDLLPLFVMEYWYLLLAFVFILLFLWWSFKKWTLPKVEKVGPYWSQVLVFLLSAPLFLIALRGGTQLRPLMPINAQQYVPNIQMVPLAYPTALSLIFSTQQKFISEKSYFSDEDVSELFPIRHKFQQDSTRIGKKKPNVVVIILESFGEECSQLLSKSKTGYTPFLDSLMEHGFYYDQAFANGLRSTQGIAAISISLPSLMEDPYLFSAYQNNQIRGIGTLLKKEGYTSAFFHGANEGTMEFEGFAKLCGFDYYLDRRAFNNDQLYDGNWGIWDRPFFQYTATTL
ncbi:MAG: phosphoglycerol transferase MdoB-like AlkP superfamily enzyme, partial [Nonlabens sp.]